MPLLPGGTADHYFLAAAAVCKGRSPFIFVLAANSLTLDMFYYLDHKKCVQICHEGYSSSQCINILHLSDFFKNCIDRASPNKKQFTPRKNAFKRLSSPHLH
jgi:hypothetical protein